MKSRINSDINTEELIDIVKSSNEEVTYDDPKTDDVKQFIIEMNIKDGTEAISTDVIYGLYCEWENGRPRTDTAIGFFKRFGKYFRRKRISGYSHYMLDPEPFDLPEKNKLVKRKTKNGEKENKKK